jgi:hypothetical protein
LPAIKKPYRLALARVSVALMLVWKAKVIITSFPLTWTLRFSYFYEEKKEKRTLVRKTHVCSSSNEYICFSIIGDSKILRFPNVKKRQGNTMGSLAFSE